MLLPWPAHEGTGWLLDRLPTIGVGVLTRSLRSTEIAMLAGRLLRSRSRVPEALGSEIGSTVKTNYPYGESQSDWIVETPHSLPGCRKAIPTNLQKNGPVVTGVAVAPLLLDFYDQGPGGMTTQ